MVPVVSACLRISSFFETKINFRPIIFVVEGKFTTLFPKFLFLHLHYVMSMHFPAQHYSYYCRVEYDMGGPGVLHIRKSRVRPTFLSFVRLCVVGPDE